MSRSGNFLANWLAHPKLRGVELDDPQTTLIRKEIVLGNSFLRQIYESWYAGLLASLPNMDGQVLELGSGGGFLESYLPLITS